MIFYRVKYSRRRRRKVTPLDRANSGDGPERKRRKLLHDCFIDRTLEGRHELRHLGEVRPAPGIELLLHPLLCRLAASARYRCSPI